MKAETEIKLTIQERQFVIGLLCQQLMKTHETLRRGKNESGHPLGIMDKAKHHPLSWRVTRRPLGVWYVCGGACRCRETFWRRR
jgi:hypothetical protein